MSSTLRCPACDAAVVLYETCDRVSHLILNDDGTVEDKFMEYEFACEERTEVRCPNCGLNYSVEDALNGGKLVEVAES